MKRNWLCYVLVVSWYFIGCPRATAPHQPSAKRPHHNPAPTDARCRHQVASSFAASGSSSSLFLGLLRITASTRNFEKSLPLTLTLLLTGGIGGFLRRMDVVLRGIAQRAPACDARGRRVSVASVDSFHLDVIQPDLKTPRRTDAHDDLSQTVCGVQV